MARYLKERSWAHHFEPLGLHVTKFMNDGLACLLTSRAMQCAKFLQMYWPEDQDQVPPLSWGVPLDRCLG